MSAPRTLIFIPTLNEAENVGPMHRELRALGLAADILFLDDNSQDGTREKLERIAAAEARTKVIHRIDGQGIGSAHLAGISFAYEAGYEQLITLDCDFTHSPADIPRLLAAADSADVTLGSRYLQPDSLPGWNLLRRSLTQFGHFLTKTFLRMPYDASGAFRIYNLCTIPESIFHRVDSKSYSFFFESLFHLARHGCTVKEIPIVLPARMYGHSKMSFVEASRSAIFLLKLSAKMQLRRPLVATPSLTSQTFAQKARTVSTI
jgi:dolichol-phosphate mannosyltransferase